MIRSIKFAILPLIIGFLFSCSSTRTALEEENLEKVKDTEIKATLDSLSDAIFRLFLFKNFNGNTRILLKTYRLKHPCVW